MAATFYLASSSFGAGGTMKGGGCLLSSSTSTNNIKFGSLGHQFTIPSISSSSSQRISSFPPSPSPSSSRRRRLYYSSNNTRSRVKVTASVLQEEQENKALVAEDSFKSKTTFPEPQTTRGGDDDDKWSEIEKWTIKIEQSINIFLTDTVVQILDTLYHDRDYPRFFVLETIARVPYFAFMSVLHLYESFGWWRRADYLKVHFAESVNEMHHLLIMEELGGNAWWFDRFLAQHIAVFYYFMTVFMYLLSPRMAYHFSECVESHAFSTYDKFLKVQGEELKKLPAPEVAVKYYTGEDMYLFDEFQTSRPPNTRRPTIENLYDVFLNIRDDEAEHCKTMKACQTHGKLRSPHASYSEDAAFEGEEEGRVLPQTDCEGIVDCVKNSL